MMSLPTFPFPSDLNITPAMRAAFKEAGVVILKGFATEEECAGLKARAFELIDGFDIAAHRTVFSTTTQRHAEDDYFLNSGGNISFFLEEEAFDEEGSLRRTKRQSINKIGHALHDLDPAFSAFSHSRKMEAAARGVGFSDPLLLQSMVIMKPPGIGGEVTCHQVNVPLHRA